MDIGSLSSWIAAIISFASAGGAVLWSIWNRPLVDWQPSGEISAPDDNVLLVTGAFGNLGDGNAHGVEIWILRDPEFEPQKIATAPVLRPGDERAFETRVHVDSLAQAVMYVKWTSAPVRRHKQCTSQIFRLEDVFELTPYASEVVQRFRSSRG